MLLGLVVLLGGISLYLNKDWFAKDTIQIYHRASQFTLAMTTIQETI